MKLRELIIVLLALSIHFAGGEVKRDVDISSEEILGHIKYLASDRLEGRRAGTSGGRKAAQYIARQFRSYGLRPMGSTLYSFKQPFQFTSGVDLGRKNKLEIVTSQKTLRLELGKDFRPVGFSAAGSAQGGLVFAGYGIDSDGLDFNDYDALDVTNKVVLLLRYSPDGTNPHGEFGRYAPLRYKAMTAREHGAAGMILVTGPADDDEEEYLMALKYDQSFADSGIPVVTITQNRAKELFQLVGESLDAVQNSINEKREPNSFEFPASVVMDVSIEKVESTTVNVVGMVEGVDPGFSDEYIVVGAHYDHLGWGGEGSLAPDTVAIHNGADDNASGTAGLLELAQWFGHNPQKRSILFVGFGAEELGLLGSADFVADPPVLLQRVHSMINMDMIGRMKDSTLVVGGAGTSSIWKDLVGRKVQPFQLAPKFDDAGYGSSDHQSFYLKDIPVLFLFTGIHDDYSRPSDDWEKINVEGEERIVRLAREIIMDLANRKVRPDFEKVGQAEPRRGGFAVYLGTIPDYSATDVEGMRLSGVREGGPAAEGGLEGGDIIIRFGEKKVKNIYDFMYALQEAKAGVPVDVVAKRGEEEITLQVVPARRRD